jgi:branched-chain amino acid transport system permease protein
MRRASLASLAGPAIAALCGLLVALGLLPSYWVFLATAVLISAVALLSLGVVARRCGMISLCQMSFAGIGAWTVAWLNVHGAPGSLILWIPVGGLAAVPLGVAIGLPALRLRGINLAIVTLGFASAFDVVLGAITFPGQTEFLPVPRPAFFESDEAYFVFCLIVYGIVALALSLLSRTRLGASWLAIRHSERAAAAHGVSIPAAKLSAFAISAFVAGVSGGLLAGYLGTLVSDNFNLMQSLALFAVATLAGAQFPEGAIIGGLMVTMVPEVLRRVGLPQDVGNVLFAVGAVQSLSTGESMSETLRRSLRRRFGHDPAALPSSDEPALAAKLGEARAEPASLAIDAMTVRYGNVTALDGVNLTVVPRSVAGLIGPNGAGKSTFIDAVTGFLPAYQGRVSLGSRRLDGLHAHVRARAGVRRTWQQTRIAPELTVGDYIRLAAGSLPRSEVEAILAWLDCPDPDMPVTHVDAGTRRLLDVAGVVAARPSVVLLDEPAAGQSYDEALRLGRRIAEIPARFGSAVLLVEHDMDLVRAACDTVTVLDFGRVIASGAPRDVLNDPAVRKAYLGVDEESAAA